MFVCTDCGNEFEEPKKHVERHGFTYPPYEEWWGCPVCGGNYEEKKEEEDEEK